MPGTCGIIRREEDMSTPLLNADVARIDPRKLRDYALNPEHPTGRFKAVFFAELGYTAANWQVLERDIRGQHLAQPAEPGQPTEFGRKFTITATLVGPSGASRQVTTVWLYRPGQDIPELVTIEPAPRGRRK